MELDQVLPKLYVGSYPRYDDIDTLKRYGITAVLNVQSEEDFKFLGLDWSEMRARYFALDIVVRHVPITDFDDDELRDKLPQAVRVLSELVNEKHDVLVHCNAGANRSPSVVIAWLSWEQGWNLDEAERHVNGCHPCAPVMDMVRLAGRDRLRRQLP
jgi:protein-tyrosine phosphatase